MMADYFTVFLIVKKFYESNTKGEKRELTIVYLKLFYKVILSEKIFTFIMIYSFVLINDSYIFISKIFTDSNIFDFV